MSLEATDVASEPVRTGFRTTLDDGYWLVGEPALVDPVSHNAVYGRQLALDHAPEFSVGTAEASTIAGEREAAEGDNRQFQEVRAHFSEGDR